MAASAEKEFPGDDRWALVTRVAESCHFEKAVQLRELLTYLARQALSNPSAVCTEQEIGVQVLGRRPNYDPQADNIVRVQIRHLRLRLEKYFSEEGAHEPVLLTVPKGSHTLRFEPRAQNPVPAPPAPPARRRAAWLAVAAAVALAAFLLGRFSMPRASAGPSAQNGVAANMLWPRLFSKDQPTSLVIADSSIVIVQNALRRSLTLSEYIDRDYRKLIEAVPEPGLRDLLRTIAGRQYTSLADATLCGELRILGAQLGSKVAVRYARHMQIRDFNSGNFILIGSSHSVPWVDLFESNLNFHFERFGRDQTFGFRNIRPAPGEFPVYALTTPATGPQESYATVAMLPNPARNGTVLIFAGVTMEATEAAGQFAMREDFPHVVGEVLRMRPGERLPFFEILLKTVAVAGAPRTVDVIAWRKPEV